MNTFLAEFDDAIEAIEKEADETYGDFCHEVLTKVQDRTPIDTTQAFRSWGAGINKPNLVEITKQEALNGSFGIDTIKPVTDQLKITDVLFMSNSAEHIIYLEYGHSRQAANGMVRKTLSEYKR